MKCNMISFIIIISILGGFMVLSANANYQNSSERSKEVAEILLKQNKSLDIVLAIDASPSTESEDESSNKIAIDFYNMLKMGNTSDIKIGYVKWSNTTLADSKILYPIDPNSSLAIENVTHWGNTCFKIGLNSSIQLLKSDPDEASNDTIVLISDGKELCNINGSQIIDCKKDLSDLDLKNVYIYAIPLGTDSNLSFLKCISNEIPDGPIVDPKKTLNPSQKKPIESLFSIKMDSTDVKKTDINTHLNVTKSVTKGKYGPQVTLKISAPTLETLKMNVVLALDSSGSLGDGGRPEYGDNIREAMPEIMNTIEEIMPSSNVSILSWDDNIDFAYSAPVYNSVPASYMSNIDPSSTRFVPITHAKNFIDVNHIFKNDSNADWFKSINDFIYYFIEKQYPKDYYYCNETESTNLSVGLDAARIILNKTNPSDYDGTLKLILFIVGRSEYAPCDENIIKETKDEYCDIHTIGLGVKDNSSLYKELVHIAGNNTERNGNKNKYHYSAGSHMWDSEAIRTAINDSMEQYYTQSLAKDIVITETIYPYLNYISDRQNNDTIDIKINGRKYICKKSVKPNPDGSTTLTISLGQDINMKPGDSIEVAFDTALNLSVPIGITDTNLANDYYIDHNTITSSVSYNWIGNGLYYRIPLPECPIFQMIG